MNKRLVIGCLLGSLLSPLANAQFAAPPDPAGDASPGGASQQQSAYSNVTTRFDGVEVDIKRLIQDPANDGSVRLVFQLANSSDTDRRMLFTGPKSTLIDELGNTYEAAETVGVAACKNKDKWVPDATWCSRKYGNVATRLAPSVPVTVMVKFKPAKGFSEELAKMSRTVSLRARLAHYSDDFKQKKTADIIVNNIPFPR